MPTRKLSDLPRAYCTDREHEPPQHMVYENGLYEHECPSCGNKIRFTVNRPTFYEQLDAMAQIAFGRKWSPVPTEECPQFDHLNGGFCETDAQLRARIRAGK